MIGGVLSEWERGWGDETASDAVELFDILLTLGSLGRAVELRVRRGWRYIV